MTKHSTIRWSALLAVACLVVTACGGEGSTTEPTTDVAQPSVQPANFLAAGLATPLTTVSCPLSGGTVTTCDRIVTVGAPRDHAAGPWCPTNISDGSVAGMWFESAAVASASP
jgi:hypothetical protein